MPLPSSKRGEFITAGKFLVVGLGNTLVGLLCIYVAKWFFGFGDTAANASGYAVGLVVSFTLNKTWTFGYVDALVPAVLKFIVVVAAAYLSNLATVLLAIWTFGVNPYEAHAIGVLPYAVLFYMGSRYIAFVRPVKC